MSGVWSVVVIWLYYCEITVQPWKWALLYAIYHIVMDQLTERRRQSIRESPSYKGSVQMGSNTALHIPLDLTGTYSSGWCLLGGSVVPFKGHAMCELWVIVIDSKHVLVGLPNGVSFTGQFVSRPGWSHATKLDYS